VSDDGLALRRRRLGATLRAMRLGCGMTGEEAGRAVDHSASWLSRLEGGQISLRPIDLRRLLDLYGVHDVRTREELERLTTRRQRQGWLSGYRAVVPDPYAKLIGYEDVATVIRSYENIVIPGLIQTREYADALFRDGLFNWPEEEIRDRTEVRVRRQEVLRRANPPRLQMIIPESVLNNVIGGRGVMQRQLDVIAEVATRSDDEVLIVPSARTRPALSVSGFEILGFRSDPPIGYTENLSGGTIVDGQDLGIYERCFDRLRALAVGPSESLDLIRQVRAQLSE
jgi:transcriptional regulator with XRE-family HTH domain